MQPRKTDLARTALQAHRAPLDMRQRRLLILCDGQRSIAEATLLLTVYSLGLAVPFMLAALAFGTAPAIIRRINSRLGMVTTVTGAVMIGVGLIMVLGVYEQIFTEIIRNAPWQPYEPTI